MPWIRAQPPGASGFLFPKPLPDLPRVTEVGMRQGLIGSDFPTQPHAAHYGRSWCWLEKSKEAPLASRFHL